jgi:hypothetical protein
LAPPITYVISKTRWKDTESVLVTLEPKIVSMTLHFYSWMYKSSPTVNEIMETDEYFIFIEGNNVKKFKKIEVLWVDCEFETQPKYDDFIK